MLTSPLAEAYGFVRSDPALALPDIELLFAPGPLFDEGLAPPEGHAVALGSILLKPQSLGRISLRSADPTAKPVIDPAYLSDEEGRDRAAMMEGLRICAKISEVSPLKELLGPIVRPRGATGFDEEVLHKPSTLALTPCITPSAHAAWATMRPVSSHPGSRSAVSADCGIADASVIPSAIRGHTHAPSMVIGAKAVELMTSQQPTGSCERDRREFT